MLLQSGACYALWSEQVIQLCERLDDTRWMAVIWDDTTCDWSLSVYAIDEHFIESVVRDPQSIQERRIG